MVFYFTATGNCLYVAKNLDCAPVSIAQEQLGKTYRADVIGVVSPIFAHDLPKNVAEFLRQATFETEYFFLVLTYGFRHGGAMIRAEKLLRDSGKRVDYINTLLMVDNALPAFDIAEELKLDKKTDENLAAIKRDISARRTFIQQPDKVNLDFHEIFLKAPFKMDPEKDFRAKGLDMYKISPECVGCGVCSKVCPKACFKIVDGKAQHDMTDCIACLACIHACKRRAIQFTFPEKNPNVRYRNPHVKLSEIIAANNRH
jgi:ferredoxin